MIPRWKIEGESKTFTRALASLAPPWQWGKGDGGKLGVRGTLSYPASKKQKLFLSPSCLQAGPFLSFQEGSEPACWEGG